MPYVTDKEKLGSPFLKRNAKLLPCQREMIVWWHKEHGLSQRKLAAMFNVSRRLITFVLHPEKLKENIARRAERGGSKAYYDKDKNREAIKDHRRYKYKTLKNRK